MTTGLYLIGGFVLGLTAGVAPGPLSALIVAHTLRHGVREGIHIALAPMITDLPIIGIALWLMTVLPKNPWPLGMISLAGAGYLGYLAWNCITAAAPLAEASPGRTGHALTKGALVNLLNPHPYLFWITVGAPLLIQLWATAPWAFVFWLLGFYAALVGAKIMLAVIVGQTNRWWTGSGFQWLNRILGGLLALFAIIILRDGLRLVGIVEI